MPESMRSISPSGPSTHGGVDRAALVHGDPRHVAQLHAEQVASGVEGHLLDGRAVAATLPRAPAASRTVTSRRAWAWLERTTSSRRMATRTSSTMVKPPRSEAVDRLAAQVLDDGAQRAGGRGQRQQGQAGVGELVGGAVLALGDAGGGGVDGGGRQHERGGDAEPGADPTRVVLGELEL